MLVFPFFLKTKAYIKKSMYSVASYRKKKYMCGYLFSFFWVLDYFNFFPFWGPLPLSCNFNESEQLPVFRALFLFTKNSSLYFFLSLLSLNATCTEFLILYPIIQLELSILLHLSTNLYINKMIVQTLKSKQCFHWSI